LQAIASLGDVVVATGGGILLRPENRKFIRDNGTSVWLDAPLDTMIERCGSGGVRPLLGDRDRMAALLAERIEAYRGADLRADGAGGSPDRIARVIASRLGRVE
ncbi:MAG: shikimate kinase, partial [Acidobacteriota bacterium]